VRTILLAAYILLRNQDHHTWSLETGDTRWTATQQPRLTGSSDQKEGFLIPEQTGDEETLRWCRARFSPDGTNAICRIPNFKPGYALEKRDERSLCLPRIEPSGVVIIAEVSEALARRAESRLQEIKKRPEDLRCEQAENRKPARSPLRRQPEAHISQRARSRIPWPNMSVEARPCPPTSRSTP
jgi:hypothetical protein